jgi:hypothetical protein
VHRVENGAVQVNDAAGAPVVRKDDVDRARKAPRAGARFRDALKRTGQGGQTDAQVGSQAGATLASAAAMTGWFRAEATPKPPAAPRLAPAAPPSIDRILIGESGAGVEARIRIGSGVLAGAEIRLTGAPGSRAVAAELLTRADGSRQTLSVAMEEIRLRLRRKGIALSERPRGADGRAASPSGVRDGSRSGGGTGR